MTWAVRAFGTVLKLETTPSGGTFASVGELVEHDFPEVSRDELDATHEESPGEYREFIPSFKNAGEYGFTVNWNPNNATHKRLVDLYDSGDTVNWQVLVPATTPVTGAFAAWVKSYKPLPPLDGVLRARFTLRLTGTISGFGS